MSENSSKGTDCWKLVDGKQINYTKEQLFEDWNNYIKTEQGQDYLKYVQIYWPWRSKFEEK